MARRPLHHVRLLDGPMVGRWAPLVVVETSSTSVQAFNNRVREGRAIEDAGAQLAAGILPGASLRSYWPELALHAEVSFEHIELCSTGTELPALAAQS